MNKKMLGRGGPIAPCESFKKVFALPTLVCNCNAILQLNKSKKYILCSWELTAVRHAKKRFMLQFSGWTAEGSSVTLSSPATTLRTTDGTFKYKSNGRLKMFWTPLDRSSVPLVAPVPQQLFFVHFYNRAKKKKKTRHQTALLTLAPLWTRPNN